MSETAASPDRIEIPARSSRLSDRSASVRVIPRPRGDVALIVENVGGKGARRWEQVTLSGSARVALIKALGGSPAEPTSAAKAEAVGAVDGDVEPTHELYVWNGRVGNGGWIAVNQGSEEEMAADETRRYERARSNGDHGAAFFVSEVDDAPGLRPEDLGVEVIA